ncbi:hypothetical protein [Acanthopleuribacter pedis]|uniref:ABC transmembrane type-1 domain-containing protein n=1 Tax=Acanthopleuribacter pedis TaxID=442870 RepID=A0A8J7U3D0_9BACT|nr:hypothetical protein [Acanthopleuribacter pedis]MBO1317136.1 hypothetical protein [Acanthopleuribacter pedis]
MKAFSAVLLALLCCLTPVFGQKDNPFHALQESQELDNARRFWFVFYQVNQSGGRTWSERMTESFTAEDVPQTMAYLADQPTSEVLRLYRFLEGMADEADELLLSGEEMAFELSETFEWEPDPLLVDWLERFGPLTVGVFVKLISPGQYSPSFKNAVILSYRLPFHSLSPVWILGSVPPSVTLDQGGMVPFAPYLLRSVVPYLSSFLWYILPAIFIGVLLGICQGYGVGWWGRGKPTGLWMGMLFRILQGSINALPRFLLIILFILLFREFRKPIAFWMIALPLGISCVPLVMTRVSDQIKAAIGSDAIPLRRSQGFSHWQILKELWRFRLFVIPLQEVFSQMVAFIYAETLIQFMVKMSEGAMAGIGNQNSLGYILVQVSYGISMARHQALSPAFERFDLWYPLLMVLTLFTLLTLGALVLRQRIERGFS